MPYLTDAQIQKMVNRAVRKVLRGNPDATNADAVAELTASGEEDGDRQAGRATGGGFAAAAKRGYRKVRPIAITAGGD